MLKDEIRRKKNSKKPKKTLESTCVNIQDP